MKSRQIIVIASLFCLSLFPAQAQQNKVPKQQGGAAMTDVGKYVVVWKEDNGTWKLQVRSLLRATKSSCARDFTAHTAVI